MQPDQQNMMASLLGSGMAKQASNTMSLYPLYQKYAVDMQSSGQQAIPFEQWAKLVQQPQAQ